MPTVAPHADQPQPTNRYPHQVVSPPGAGACCVSAMEWLDAPQVDVSWVYQYRRCQRCGFSVRVLLRELRDAAPIASRRVG